MCNLKIAKPKWLAKWLARPTKQDAVIKSLAKKIKDLEQSLSEVPIAKPEPPAVEAKTPIEQEEVFDIDLSSKNAATGKFDHTEIYHSGTHLLFNLPKSSLELMVNYANWAMDRHAYYKEDKDRSFDMEILITTDFVELHYIGSSLGTRRKQARHFTGLLRQLKIVKVIAHEEFLRGRLQPTDRVIYCHGQRKNRWTVDKLLKQSDRQYRQNNVSKLHGWGT